MKKEQNGCIYNKVRFYRFSLPMLVYGFSIEGNCISALIEEGIPEGAKIDGAYYDIETQVLRIQVSHESFEGVPEGGKIPTYDIKYANTSVV